MRFELNLLLQDEIVRIHEGALRVLAGTGVQMDLPGALDVFRAAGAWVDEPRRIVRMREDLVSRALATAPEKVTLYGRGEGREVSLPGAAPSFGTWVNSVRILDRTTRERRTATLRDLEEFARLADALDGYSWVQPLLSPQDVPKENVYYHAWATMLTIVQKHVIGPGLGSAGTRVLAEICALIAGGREKAMQRPLITLTILSQPPLGWSGLALGALMEAAAHRIPVNLGSGPAAGATGPVTMAGTLVQAHAEVLAAIVLSQLVNPGTPVFYSSASRVMDMRTGGISLCSPEWFLFRICVRQMGRFLKVPVYTMGLFTDAKLPDAQSGYEKGISAVAGALGGDLVAGCTLEANKTMDMGDLVIGDELIAFIKRLGQGFEVDEESLALAEIARVGPGGEYLSLPHTLRHFRREIWQPALSDRSSRGDWEAQGRKDLWQKARERADSILAGYRPSLLPPDQVREIERIVSGSLNGGNADGKRGRRLAD